MQALRRIDGKWIAETPSNLSAWLWQSDGTDAVVKDGKITYCATPALIAAYEAKEQKASTFSDLDRLLFAKETPVMPDQSAAWCKTKGSLCSEVPICSQELAAECRT